MIKFIEAPDIHADPAWIDTSEKIFDAIREATISHEVDFVLMPGDMHNRHFVDSDKSGINRIRNKVKEQLKICPVAAIEGTKSHDAPGSYRSYEDMGLILMRPGITYGYKKTEQNRLLNIFRIGDTRSPVDAILFGINELNTETIHAQNNLSATEANAIAENLFKEYLETFVAPNRAMFLNSIAIGMLHGVISDATRENSTDRIVRSSAIVTHTETLALAGLDRWSLGDQHIPWESSVISAGYAGYAGIDDHVWNYLNFVPAMNLVQIDEPGATPIITRIPYGLPERRKLYSVPSEFEPNVKYWLELDEIPSGLPEDVRVTTKPAHKIERRIQDATKEYILSELFKIYDPATPDSVIKKVEKLSARISRTSAEPLEIQVIDVEIFGCIFFPGGHVHLPLAGLADGLTRVGEGNGVGKSSILSFCSPYPLTVARMPESGHASAIKEFFNGPDSRVIKRVLRNGEEHRHEIHIKGAHTNSASTECYLYINNENILPTKSFSDMNQKCEELYGPFDDYFATTWVAQPFNGQGSGLMDAKKIDARNVVLNIAGQDRSQEKEEALAQVRAHEKQRDEKASWIAGAEEFLEDPFKLKGDLPTLTAKVEETKTALFHTEELGKSQAATLATMRELKSKNDAELQRRNSDDNRKREIERKISESKTLIDSLKENESLLAKISESEEIKRRNSEKQIAYDAALSAWNKKKSDLEISIQQENQRLEMGYQSQCSDISQQISKARSVIANAELVVVESCPKCGYIAPDAEERLIKAKTAIEANQAILNMLQMPEEPLYLEMRLPEDPKPTAPTLEHVPEYFADMSKLRQDIESARTANSEIIVLSNELTRLQSSTYAIDDEIDSKVLLAESEYSRLRTDHMIKTVAHKTAEGDLSNHEKAIAQAEEKQAAISIAREDLSSIESELRDWQIIAKALQPSAIPAMELEQSLDVIDKASTKILQPFLSGRYSIRTETIPSFDILIHDGESGQESSFFKKNQGHKAFFADAYTKALIQRRNERQHRSYSPIVYDEADAPIEPARISMYYDMQDAYFSGRQTKVLVVSQKDPAYIQSRIDVKELY